MGNEEIKALVPTTPEALAALSWTEIVELLVESLTSEDVDTPDKVVRAAELMLSGYPRYKVAKELKVTPKTVKRWTEDYPIMMQIVKSGRTLLSMWRMARIEQQFISALEVSEEVLNASAEEVEDKEGNVTKTNAKVMGIKAQHARYILDLFMKNQHVINFNVDLTPETNASLLATESGLAYLAQAMKRTDEDVLEGQFTEAKEEIIYGTVGELSLEDGKTQCHTCGGFYQGLARHVQTKHNITPEIYEVQYDLEMGVVLDEKPTGSN